MERQFLIHYAKTFNREVRVIRSYLADKSDSLEIANKYVDKIRSASEALAIFPKRHKIYKIDSIGRELRSFIVGNYRIIYYVDEQRNVVEIYRIIHSRRDIDSLI